MLVRDFFSIRFPSFVRKCNLVILKERTISPKEFSFMHSFEHC